MPNGPLTKLRDFTRSRTRVRKSVMTDNSQQPGQFMLLIREMIDMAYVYESDTDKFYQKFREKISVESLRDRGIIEPDMLLHKPHYHRMCSELKREDAELWALLKAGFKTRELMVIYGHTNINSVYVKINRLRKRLNRKMRELIDDRGV